MSNNGREDHTDLGNYMFFEKHFENAQLHGMGSEWFTEFVSEIKDGQGIQHACVNASYEWDL
jgi:hypothetical protein